MLVYGSVYAFKIYSLSFPGKQIQNMQIEIDIEHIDDSSCTYGHVQISVQSKAL